MSENENLYLKSQLLLAMPSMADPRFHKSVILMVQHDAQGAMGIVINNVLPSLKFGGLLAQFDVDIQPDYKDALFAMPVFAGGPVETERGFLIHSREFLTNDTVSLTRDISISTTLAALKALARGAGPKKRKFALGYAGWGAGQLDQEIHDNAWMTAPATNEIVFGTEPELMWEKAMNALGVSPSMLSSIAGRA